MHYRQCHCCYTCCNQLARPKGVPWLGKVNPMPQTSASYQGIAISSSRFCWWNYIFYQLYTQHNSPTAVLKENKSLNESVTSGHEATALPSCASFQWTFLPKELWAYISTLTSGPNSRTHCAGFKNGILLPTHRLIGIYSSVIKIPSKIGLKNGGSSVGTQPLGHHFDLQHSFPLPGKVVLFI